ncbi:MAG: AMP-binding protein [Sphingopyxis sp.]|nr:AMP-binding protein [Sphingopyxis sp.]
MLVNYPTLAERIDARLAEAKVRRTAYVIDGQATDHATAMDRLHRAFGLFTAKGLVPGDRLAMISTDVAAVATLMLAGIRFGLGMVNLNPDMTAHDMGIALGACQPAHLFVDQAIFDRMAFPQGLGITTVAAQTARSGGLLSRLRRNMDGDAKGFWSELAATEPAAAPPHPAPDAAAMMLFTSGTTSTPKVVVLSHANLSAQIGAFADVYDYDADSRILNPLPLHFTDGMLHGPIAALVFGATLYRPTRFDFQQIEDLVHSIYRDNITHFIVVPALLSMLDRLGEAFADAFDSAAFRYIRSSGDALPETLWRSIEARFGVRVVNTYGMSETVCEATYAGPDDASRVIGSIGRAVGCELKIVDEDGAELPLGESGELLIRGDIIMQGYLGQPELTATTIRDGWMHTGDIATMDADGIVRIAGRRKALIITGGMNVQPQDISDCLLAHPDVAEAHAYGLPHALWGEQIAAAVRLRPDRVVTDQQLIAHCAATLSPHKVPRLVAIVDELPRNAAGKVLVDKLRAATAVLDQSAGGAGEGDMFATVQQLAAREFGVDAATLRLTSEPANTPGWNSLAHINLVSSVEATFGVTFGAADILRFHSLNDFVLGIQRQRGG